MEKKVAHLNVFLVKDTFNHSDQIINQEGCKGPFELSIPGCGKGILYIKSYVDHPPKWSSLFEDYLDIKKIGNVSNVSAAFLIKVADRYLHLGKVAGFLLRKAHTKIDLVFWWPSIPLIRKALDAWISSRLILYRVTPEFNLDMKQHLINLGSM